MRAPDTPAVSAARRNRPMTGPIEGKLARYQKSAAASIVELADPCCLTDFERRELLKALTDFNFVIYQCPPGGLDKFGVKILGRQLGIDRTDHNFCADGDDISSVQVSDQGDRPRYIPYSDRPLGWHTDGYYYGGQSGRAIRSFILHCVTPAPAGGENSLLDPDIVFLLLSQIDPSLPVILSDPSTFTIPADASQLAGACDDRTGPVFSIDPASGALHMRYTARRRSIQWKPEPEIREAARYLKDVIEGASGYTVKHTLESGQGIICNNVLHRRSGFVNGDAPSSKRLMYRARYHDRIPGTQGSRANRRGN